MRKKAVIYSVSKFVLLTKYALLLILVGLIAAPALAAGQGEVTGIKAVCRNGQTFVTFKDAAEGEAGAAFRIRSIVRRSRSRRPTSTKPNCATQACSTTPPR